ncbi:hypothetical protein F5Y06DRAFT_278343 [Hypoxylon sp. FL0890]|nr:hypothetical protein F5Y06DRAFT_278343 [Hypoxylon sp. FL0890]
MSSVCGAGIARFVTFINIGRGIAANMNDLTYFTTPVFAWTMIESSLAVVGANLPLLRPLLHRDTYTPSHAWSLLRSWRSKHSLRDTNGDASWESVEGNLLHLNVQGSNKRKFAPDHVPAEYALQADRGLVPDGGIRVQRTFEVL